MKKTLRQFNCYWQASTNNQLNTPNNMTMQELNTTIAAARAANIRRASQYKPGMPVLCAPALFTSVTAAWLPGVIVSIHQDGRSAKVKLNEFNSIVEVWITAIKAA